MQATILDKIVAEKKRDVEDKKRSMPVTTLKERITGQAANRDFARALSGVGLKLIAEVKKASPSRGILCPDFDPQALARTYAQNGAAAISVLTEVNHFQGSLENLETISGEVDIPILRKDFIFDEYQVYETAAGGADALLLITAILDSGQLEGLLALSRDLGLACLVEVHNENEVEKALLAGADVIGINNRDLNTFNVDIDTTRRLRSLIPEGKIVVSESGINTRNDIMKLNEWRINAVLVGEALVTTDDIPSKIKELLP
jgi:indole-3-glycerol phosphate synthase